MAARKKTKSSTDTHTTQKKTLDDVMDEIRTRSFEIYKERLEKNIPGDDFTDWLQAENEIRIKYHIED